VPFGQIAQAIPNFIFEVANNQLRHEQTSDITISCYHIIGRPVQQIKPPCPPRRYPRTYRTLCRAMSEWKCAKTLLVKWLLADFLHEQVQGDWISETDALWVAREWLHDAAERRYC
jgi:hypothetical protein